MAIHKYFPPNTDQNSSSSFKFTFRAKITTLWILGGIIVAFVLYFAHILPVFIWAAITAYIFNPVASFFSDKTRIPRVLSIILLYIFLGILLFWGIKSFAPLLTTEVSDLVNGDLSQPTTVLGRIASLGNVSLFGIDLNLKEQVLVFSNWIKDQLPSQALPIFFGAVGKLVLLLIYFVVTFYLMLESGNYVERLKSIIPSPYRPEISELFKNINSTLGAYIRAQVVLIFIMSAASFIVLYLLKIRYAVILSIATGILEVIPIAGPICATAIASIVALFQVGTPFGISNAYLAILVIISYFALRQLEDYLIIPNIVSKFVSVHPLVAIFSLMVGGAMAGILGLFLAIPAAAVLKVFFEYLYRKLSEE